MTEKPIRIVTVIDGGGTRGYYTVWLLEKLFQEAGCDLINESSLIGGTSTGGIIAISKAVGKLNNEALSNLYVGEDAKKIFVGSFLENFKNIYLRAEAYDSPKLEELARTTLTGHSGSIENNQKFFVTACSPKKDGKDDEDLIVDIISNYKPIDNDNIKLIIESQRFIVGSGDDKNNLSEVEAIRATSDIPGAFKLISKNDVTFYDGGFLYNNPILIAYGEARNQFPNDTIILLSFGTGAIIDADGISNDQLKEMNRQSNSQLEHILTPPDDATRTVIESNLEFVGPIQGIKNGIEFKRMLDLSKRLALKSPSAHTLFENFMDFRRNSEVPDENLFVFRFESKLEHHVEFTDTSKEGFTTLMNGALDLAESKHFKKTAELLRKVVIKNNGGKEPSYTPEKIALPK
ncbi:hypothetical protein ACTFIU_002445 [Dictyostelium citrinum]